ncbi:MAG: glycoside hydrolase family 3 N-terminal domain-containing protein, partial [Planctomycetota bacterium]
MTFSAPLLVPAIRLDHEDAEDQAARALRQAAAPWLAGFCLFGGEAAQVRGLTTRLRETAHRPIFIASDMERGAGQQVEGLAVLPEAGVWGRAATPEEVFAYGEQTARDAVSVGVDVIFAPVLDVRSECDNPIVGNRSFGWDPFRVTHLGAAFARGVLRGGALPVAKHYPGHGPTTTDSHDAVPVVRTSRRRLVSRDLAPFHALVAADVCPAVMTAHVAYPALDPSGVVATFSRPILDALRSAAGDEANVAIVTDALGMEGACAGIGETEAARRALLAGCDLLLYPRDADAVAAALEAPTEVTDAATSRVRAFLGRLALVAAEAAGKAGPAAGED